MAGAKHDTRQKMIGMMYLVFIAMLALNISKEVLATLGLINNDVTNATADLFDDSSEKYVVFQNNSQNEINFHNLKLFHSNLHKIYIVFCSFVCFLCLIKKNKSNIFIPEKKLLYFFFLPGLYYLVGEFIINFPITYQGVNNTYTFSRSNIFTFQEVNEFLFALGAFLYSVNLTRKKI